MSRFTMMEGLNKVGDEGWGTRRRICVERQSSGSSVKYF